MTKILLVILLLSLALCKDQENNKEDAQSAEEIANATSKETKNDSKVVDFLKHPLQKIKSGFNKLAHKNKKSTDEVNTSAKHEEPKKAADEGRKMLKRKKADI